VKTSHLVCQHLEDISREALEKHQKIIKHYVRRRNGVYALYRKGKLYYVGLAKNLRSRLTHHLRDRHSNAWDRFSVYLTLGDGHLRELESLILRIVQPKGNKQKGKFPKSEDIRRRFARDVKDRLNYEVALLLGNKPKKTAPQGRGTKLRRMKLRAWFKGKKLRAQLLKGGRVRFGGKFYESLSTAAAKACKRRTCNGWTFWKYLRAPGDWATVDHLRK
jgi:hypothetical protein